MAEDQAAGRPPAAGNTILALGAGEAGPEPAAAPGMGMGQGGGRTPSSGRSSGRGAGGRGTCATGVGRSVAGLFGYIPQFR